MKLILEYQSSADFSDLETRVAFLDLWRKIAGDVTDMQGNVQMQAEFPKTVCTGMKIEV